MNGFRGVLANLDWSVPLDLLTQAIPALLCIMIHEISHGAMAYALGDRTAKEQGRLSLNPLRHVDWVGLIMLLLFHIGWAKPVQVDPRRFRRPKKGMALTALAGPLSNFFLSVFLLFLFGLLFDVCVKTIAGERLLSLLQVTAYLSISLCLFNLVPLPPLDGSKVLFAFLPDRLYARMLYLERYGMFLVIALVLVLNRVCAISPISAAAEAVFQQLFRVAVWSNSLVR